MPALTTANTLIQAANILTEAIERKNPQPEMTWDAINQMISIFKAQAENEKDVVTAQRAAKERAQAERVRNEETMTPAPTDEVRFEVNRYPNVDLRNMSQNRVITQEEEKIQSIPASNTRQQRREQTITQEFAYRMSNLHVAMQRRCLQQHQENSQTNKQRPNNIHLPSCVNGHKQCVGLS